MFLVSKTPGVSTIFTRLPLLVATPTAHVLVTDSAAAHDSNFFSPRSVFPNALLPTPVLPTKAILVLQRKIKKF